MSIDTIQDSGVAPQDAMSEIGSTLEGALQQGRAFIQDNPGLAVVGGASIIALIVLASKRSSAEPSLFSQMDLKRLQATMGGYADSATATSADVAATLSDAVVKALPGLLPRIEEIVGNIVATTRGVMNGSKHS